MAYQAILRDPDLATDYFEGLFKSFEAAALVFHEQFHEDDRDFLGIPPSGKCNSEDNHREWIKSVYGLNTNKSKDEWKDTSHIGGLKLRSKYNALVAHLMSDILKDGKVTGSLQHTKESDIEELFNKGELPGFFSEEQVHQLVQDSEKALDKAEDILLDNKQESSTEAVYYQAIRDLAKYGICALETGVREDKKIRNYAPEIIESPEGGTLKLVPTPSFKDSFLVKAERISPYNIFLDPEAKGDPQSGVGVFRREKISLDELSRLRDIKYYDSKAIIEILDDYHGQISTDAMANGADLDTKPFTAYRFWGDISRVDLEAWKKDGNKLVKKLIKELESSEDYDYTDKYASFPCQAVLIDSQLVYLSPLLTANQERPIAYGRMIPVEDTNYAMGVFALGREPARVMSKIWSRALNNETIVGSAMFTYDDKFVNVHDIVFKPGGSIKLKSGSTALSGKGRQPIEQLQFQSVSNALLVLFDKLDLLLDELTMIPRNLIGVSDSSRRTATEVTSNLSSAQVILLSIRRNFDKDIIEKDLADTYHYLQNDKSTPQDALADAFVKVYGAETFALKVVNKQMVQELLQMIPSLSQVAPDLISSFNWTELTSEILEGLGFDKLKFLNTPALKSQLDQANQQLQQLSSQMEQMQKQSQEVQTQLENTTKENQDLKLKNYQLSSQGKVEAKLNLEQMNSKQLQDEIKRLKENFAIEKKILVESCKANQVSQPSEKSKLK